MLFKSVVEAIFYSSIFLILYTFFIYPSLVILLSKFKRPLKKPHLPGILPSVTILVPVYNGESFIEKKLNNLDKLDYPKKLLEVLIISDGCNDRTVEFAKSKIMDYMKIVQLPRNGKNVAINKGVELSKGEIIIISDVDSLLYPDAIKQMVPWFTLPQIGGVCGKKIITKGETNFSESQVVYNSYQEKIKTAESIILSTMTNEGKIHGIRRNVFRNIPPNCSDDLFNLLSVESAKLRFVFDHDVKAIIPLPSKDSRHEIGRRRRIVKAFYHNLVSNRNLLNPVRNPIFWLLFVSVKVLRRVVPLLLIIEFIANLLLAENTYFLTLILIQMLIVMSGLLHHFFFLSINKGKFKILSNLYYFQLGMLGTFYGLIDFLFKSNSSDCWEPRVIRSAEQN